MTTLIADEPLVALSDAELCDEAAAHEPEPPPPIGLRIANLIAVVLPFLGFIAVMVYLWGVGFSWTMLALLVGMYGLTAIGITIGFHRLLIHRSFQILKLFEYAFAVEGSMAV